MTCINSLFQFCFCDSFQRMLERAMLRREKLKDHMSKERKPNRLAELATKINGWEDDVDHPRKNFTSSSKPAPPVPKVSICFLRD